VRHAFWCIFLTQAAKGRREIFIFEILKTTWIRSSKCFVLCRCLKISRAKEQAKVLFTCFVQRGQLGIIAKHLTWRKVRTRCTSPLDPSLLRKEERTSIWENLPRLSIIQGCFLLNFAFCRVEVTDMTIPLVHTTEDAGDRYRVTCFLLIFIRSFFVQSIRGSCFENYTCSKKWPKYPTEVCTVPGFHKEGWFGVYETGRLPWRFKM